MRTAIYQRNTSFPPSFLPFLLPFTPSASLHPATSLYSFHSNKRSQHLSIYKSKSENKKKKTKRTRKISLERNIL